MDNINKELTSIGEYITGPALWVSIGQGVLKIIIIVILALMIVRISRSIIDRLLTKRKHGPIRISERRENTLNKLIKSVIAYVVYFTAFIMILDNALGFKIGPLIAGAGVAGLAIGFGAQNLVRDIISGFFIIFEDQFSVGDYITAAGVEGTVEEIGLRTTKIQSWTGEQNVIPNGNITQVTNYSIHNGLAVIDVNIPYENDIEAAEKIIEIILADLPEKYDELVSVPFIYGVQSLEVSHVILRVVAETLPASQWSSARAIRKDLKDGLYKAGIDIPAPRLIMYSRDVQHSALEKDR